jgi:type IV pilus assembly protein PilE
MKKRNGFTLIELMIVVAVVGLLAVIAYPSYLGYLRRTNRVDATAGLMRVASAQEKYFVQNNTYATTAQITTLGLNNSERGWYTITIAPLGTLTQGYTATATAVAGKRQINDLECRTFSITSTGVKAAAKSDSSDSSGNCWR